MANKVITAYFATPDDAFDVQAKLIALGATDIFHDRIEGASEDGQDNSMVPLNFAFPAYGYLNMGPTFNGPLPGTLAFGDVQVYNGQGDGQGATRRFNITLTARVPEAHYQDAVQKIREVGGHLEES